jgi:hypothetical protein
VLCPDGPIRPTGGATRLRELFGAGFVLLTNAGPASPAVDATTTGVPLVAYRLEWLDQDGVLAAALAAQPGRSWLVRPDGHLAAVLDGAGPAQLAVALARACGGGPG